MLVIHQAILIPSLRMNLLSPMQLRDNDLCVNDEPKFMVLTPTEGHNAIMIPSKEDDMDNETRLRIPLSINGVISYFPSRKPMRKEYEKADLDMIVELTAEAPEWDPTMNRFQDQEAEMINSQGDLKDDFKRWKPSRIVAALNTFSQNEVPMGLFGVSLARTAHIGAIGMTKPTAKEKRSASKGIRDTKSVATSKCQHAVKAKDLAKRWGIGLHTVQRTLDATTQSSVRTILHPTLSRRFRTNDWQLRYRRLSHSMFTDTLEATTSEMVFCQVRPLTSFRVISRIFVRIFLKVISEIYQHFVRNVLTEKGSTLQVY